jgi:hypothetical protein
MGSPQVVDRVLLNAVATGSATFLKKDGSTPQDGFHHHISWATGVTAGQVTIECADSSTYAGTWAVMAVVTFSGTAPNQDYVYTPGQPKAIRHRITTAVSGGGAPSVTTRLVGSN